MPSEIEFSDAEPRYVFERDCLAFRARVDGRPVDCLATVELLMTRFGATDRTEEAITLAYREHESEIQLIARSHIEHGWINNENQIVLTTRFTQLEVSYDERLEMYPVVLAAADASLRILKGIIGPNAERVSIRILGTEEPLDRAPMRIEIVDPGLPHVTNIIVPPRQWKDSSSLAIALAGLWGTALQARSRRLFLMSG